MGAQPEAQWSSRSIGRIGGVQHRRPDLPLDPCLISGGQGGVALDRPQQRLELAVNLHGCITRRLVRAARSAVFRARLKARRLRRSTSCSKTTKRIAPPLLRPHVLEPFLEVLLPGLDDVGPSSTPMTPPQRLAISLSLRSSPSGLR